MSVTRRTLLRGAAGAVGAGAGASVLGGCGSGGRPVQVVAVWSGSELELFRRVLRDYPGPVDVISGGDNIDALLRARHSAGNSPDVAVVSRPGLIAGYARAGWLEPLDDRLGDRFPRRWRELLRLDGALYGLWVKGAHKSLIWRLPGAVTQEPQDWPALATLVRKLAVEGGPAPLAMGAADGWVLTDWLENRLATLLDLPSYDALARGDTRWDQPKVRQAFTDLAELWSVPGAFPGGPRRALLTQMEDAVLQVVLTRRATMVYEGDFVAGVVNRFQPPAATAVPFRFPGQPRTTSLSDPRPKPPLIVGGDAAVVFKGSTEGMRLVRWLVEGASFQPWIAAGGYLSPNSAVDRASYPTVLSGSLAAQLTDENEDLRFDLSDRLPGALTGADGQGSWQILQDFFADVTVNRWAGEAAVSRAVSRLDRAVQAIRTGR